MGLPGTTWQPSGNRKVAVAMIGLREIRALGPNQLIWDSGKSAAAGFGARRRTEIAVRYILKYAPRMAGSGGT